MKPLKRFPILQGFRYQHCAKASVLMRIFINTPIYDTVGEL